MRNSFFFEQQDRNNQPKIQRLLEYHLTEQLCESVPWFMTEERRRQFVALSTAIHIEYVTWRAMDILCRLRLLIKPKALEIWLNKPNLVFGDLTPLEMLNRQRFDELEEMLYRLESGTPT